MVLAFSAVFLIAGIITIAAPKSKGGGIAAGVFYLVAALIGFVSLGTYSGLKIWAIDLVIWAVIAVILGIVFIIGSANITRLARVARFQGNKKEYTIFLLATAKIWSLMSTNTKNMLSGK